MTKPDKKLGSAETGGEKAAPYLLQKVTMPLYVLVAVNEFLGDWRKGDFDLPKLASLDAEAIESAIERWASDPNFPSSSQNQTVSSGVEGAHEGTTADKSGEPEKLNNAQKLWDADALVSKFSTMMPCDCDHHVSAMTELRDWLQSNAVAQALAESSLSSPPPEFRFCPNGYRSHVCFNGLCSVCGDPAVSEFPKAPPTPTVRGAESAHSGKQNTADKSELLPTQLPKEK